MPLRKGSVEGMERKTRLGVVGNFRHSTWEWSPGCDQRDEGMGTGWHRERAQPRAGSCQAEPGAAAAQGELSGRKPLIPGVATAPPCRPCGWLCPLRGAQRLVVTQGQRDPLGLPRFQFGFAV